MTIPSDATGELAIVAAVLENNGDGAHGLAPDLFATDAGIRLAEAIRDLVAEKQPINAATVSRKTTPQLVSEALGSLGGGYSYWAEILKEKRALRAIQATANGILEKVRELNSEHRPVANDTRSIICEASSELMRAAKELDGGQRRTMKENIEQLIEMLEASDRGERPPTIPTGLPSLDAVMGGGLRMGEMSVLGARTSVGKSALAVWIAKCASAAGKVVLYASREMSVPALTARTLSAESGAPVRAYDGIKHLSTEKERALIVAMAKAKKWPMVFRQDLKSIPAVRAEAAAVKPDLVIIDHIGIFDAGLSKGASPYEIATANSNAARDMAFESKIAVLVLAQVNRSGAAEEMPRLDHLKNTGALEEDARVVLLVNRLKELTATTQELQLNLAKNTDGALKLLRLHFDAPCCVFNEIHDLESHP